MTSIVRWGILGTGRIARNFAADLRLLPDARLAAVGSRTREAAAAFAAATGAERAHGSYEELAADGGVDLVYIATPHPLHAENALTCLRAGRAVLCEKPFALNRAQAEEVVATARSRSLFLMEAMWTLCFPAMRGLLDRVREGALGELRLVQASFCFRAEWEPERRLLNPRLGGGALLDVGVYPLALARALYGGPPERIATLAHIGETGVDEQNTVVLGYPGGALAALTSAVRTTAPQEAVVCGTDAFARIAAPWWRPRGFTVHRGEQATTHDFAAQGNGYAHEAAEAMACLREGRLESGLVPWRHTLDVMETMDRVRAAWGLRYPGEPLTPA